MGGVGHRWMEGEKEYKHGSGTRRARIRMKGSGMGKTAVVEQVSGANPLASWVYRQRREFESKGRKDQRNWCWHTRSYYRLVNEVE